MEKKQKGTRRSMGRLNQGTKKGRGKKSPKKKVHGRIEPRNKQGKREKSPQKKVHGRIEPRLRKRGIKGRKTRQIFAFFSHLATAKTLELSSLSL